ncbi:MAG: bifunctional 3-deoxy-7-phosphoheptulonate synthase/chorismate mutase type II [Muribaculaceae bacterium]|nr:bifunctional 3-deoxy-7-phosphoheptulonate synthase/chorismate mutase type II [Muribaculaceae bacterium]
MKDIKPLFDDESLMKEPIIIAGPCSAESEQQVLDTARRLAAGGVRFFRAGIWKPRTMPGCFEGVGIAGLPWLRRVKEETGMLVGTEVASSAHVRTAVAGGVDILWIGARTAASPFAMQEIADTLAELRCDLPVLVKNPVNPDLDLWIGAVTRLYNAGVRRIGVIHRGFSSYGKHVYRNQPMWAIPFEFARRFPDIPVICDPSHITGSHDLVAPLSRHALAMGFDGLIIESHCNPECALSDASQQLLPEELTSLMKELIAKNKPAGTPELDSLRGEIDQVDNEILDLLAKRMEISKRIGEYKKQHNMMVVQLGRHDRIMKDRTEKGEKLGLPAPFIGKIMSAIHEESVKRQL